MFIVVMYIMLMNYILSALLSSFKQSKVLILVCMRWLLEHCHSSEEAEARLDWWLQLIYARTLVAGYISTNFSFCFHLWSPECDFLLFPVFFRTKFVFLLSSHYANSNNEWVMKVMVMLRIMMIAAYKDDVDEIYLSQTIDIVLINSNMM